MDPLLRKLILPMFLVVLMSFSATAADEPSLAERLGKIAPHASGIAQIEVTEIKEIDRRPSDGNLFVNVRFRILQSSGVTTDQVQIVKAQGGLRPPNAPPFKPHGPVKLDTFRTGERYWVVFCSQNDREQYPQGIVISWTEKDHPELLDEAIRADHYAHRPQYEPLSGLTYSYRIDKDSWRVSMERDGKRLWEVTLPGQKFKGDRFDGEWRMLHRGQWPTGLEHVEKTPSDWFLFAETVTELAKGNSYQLPADQHRLTYAMDAESGKTVAIWVSRIDLGPTSTPSVIQFFDVKTGKIQREERFDSLASGGLVAGAKTENWLRKTVRTPDPATGQLNVAEILRHTESPEGSKYVPVNPQ